MLVKIPYHRTSLDLDIKKGRVTICAASDREPLRPGEDIVRSAMAEPIESKTLAEMAGGKKRVCIVINDVTRPTPSGIIVTEILKELSKCGIRDGTITLLVANGNHRAVRTEELRHMLGDEIVNRIKIVNHVAANEELLVYMGETSMGIPIIINKVLAESDLRIITGTIRPHQSAGYSGGRKSILPGCAGVKSIRIHHSFPIFPLSPQLGKCEGNPFHEQALEGARSVGVDFMVNVIENAHGQIIDAVAGDLEAAHREGIKRCASVWMYEMDRMADIIITSPGGYPKDINLHQSQKALAPCELCLKDGGVIILVAGCADGAGHIPDWFRDSDSPQEVMERFKKEGWTPIANAKPFLMARPLCRYQVIAVCAGVDAEVLREMFMIPACSIQEAYDIAMELCGIENPEIVVLPVAGDIIPFV